MTSRADSADAIVQGAVQAHREGRIDAARTGCERALALDPHHADALHLRALIAYGENNLAQALHYFERAHAAAPSSGAICTNLGNALSTMGRLDEAARVLRRALELDPNSASAHNNLGNVYGEMGRLEEAEASYRRAIDLEPQYASALYNLALTRAERGDHDEAERCYRAVTEAAPNHASAWHNLGELLRRQGNLTDAAACLRRALEVRPSYAEALNSLGTVLYAIGRAHEAAECFRGALQLKPDFAIAHSNLGGALREEGRIAEAILHFRAGLNVKPDDAELLGALFYCLQLDCAWTGARELESRVLALQGSARGDVAPFVMLCTSAGPALQRAFAETHWKNVYGQFPRLAAAHSAVAAPLRVGYLSADFREHPVAYLTAELFELHERARVEVYAYSLHGAGEKSEARERIKAAAHHFVDVQSLSTRAIAERIYADGIAVLVDLSGYTQHARTGVLAMKPAPVQVSYLGYPGTMGSTFIDYLITDRFVTPPEAREHYTEKLVSMPNCFQPNDRRKAIAQEVPGREACGLPRDGFVFCSFNKSYKLTPRVFEAWMRLLKAVPDSILWLSDARAGAMENLKLEAVERGVEAQRLVFAPRVDTIAEHLGRHRHASLFLDTAPYNAHTTASDALWAGLPVLTCAGQTFASRVAGSLLNAVGLPELVTHTLEDYEALALALARDPARLAALRTRLAENRLTHPLFDSARFTRDLERAYALMWENYARGNPPSEIDVRDAERQDHELRPRA